LAAFEATEYNSGKWQMANGKWQMANGKWQMANGKWLMTICSLQFAVCNLPVVRGGFRFYATDRRVYSQLQ
jgi:hypothetical protein